MDKCNSGSLPMVVSSLVFECLNLFAFELVERVEDLSDRCKTRLSKSQEFFKTIERTNN
jgi:hypothetical protein